LNVRTREANTAGGPGGGNLQYDTSKAAIAGLTRGLAADHSAEGIGVNAVGPGPIFTSFH
jgi:2-hydroxycyclohexanecarboxyl-CoA dehydrogenase